MSESKEAASAGPAGNGTATDSMAAALALAGASREEADAFLKKQAAFLDMQASLIVDQRDHLHEQLKQQHLDIWERWFGIFLRVATAIVGVVLAAGIVFLVWDASRSQSLLIEPFSVPPDFASRGMSGQVLAQKLLDRLRTIENENIGLRPPTTFSNNWDQSSLKVEIPETGVSLSELDRFLRLKLGSDTHVTGEVVRTDTGLTFSARAGSFEADSVSGPETDLDTLIRKLAEAVYGRAQPYRYGIYLTAHGRIEEAVTSYKSQIGPGPASQRAFGYSGLSNLMIDHGTLAERERLIERANSLDTENILIWASRAAVDFAKSHPEDVVRSNRRALSLLADNAKKIVRDELVPSLQRRFQGQTDLVTGDFRESARRYFDIIDAGGTPGIYSFSPQLAEALVGEHDPTAARTAFLNPDSGNGIAPGNNALLEIRSKMLIAAEVEDWAGLIAEENSIEPLLSRYPGVRSYLLTLTDPLVALAQARLGNFAAADARIAATPLDCYICLRTRAQIAILQGQFDRGEMWLERAVSSASSIPFAYSSWGLALLAGGKPDQAIEKFKLANQKGPHFADPLEGWGEALMAKNQSHLALVKFAEAEKYAPNWGRLHLKWGEALVYSGKRDEAKAQFARASMLDLTPSEKAELARMGHV
jgi:tetratricopeptide (TPR) repeat protein